MHVADVDEIRRTQSVHTVRWRLVQKPPASGKGRTLQPRVEHEPPLSQLQLHAGVGEVRHLGGKFRSYRRIIKSHYYFVIPLCRSGQTG